MAGVERERCMCATAHKRAGDVESRRGCVAREEMWNDVDVLCGDFLVNVIFVQNRIVLARLLRTTDGIDDAGRHEPLPLGLKEDDRPGDRRVQALDAVAPVAAHWNTTERDGRIVTHGVR